MDRYFHEQVKKYLIEPELTRPPPKGIAVYKIKIRFPEGTEVNGDFTKEELFSYDGFAVGAMLDIWECHDALVGVLQVPRNGHPYMKVKSTLHKRMPNRLSSEERKEYRVKRINREWRFYLQDLQRTSFVRIDRQDEEGLFAPILKKFKS